MNTTTTSRFAVALYRHYRTLHRNLSRDERDLDQRFDAIMARLDGPDGQAAERRRLSFCPRLPFAVAHRRLLGAARGAGAGASAIVVAKVVHTAQGVLYLALTAGCVTAALVIVLTDAPGRKSPRRRREHTDVPASTQ